MRVNGEISLKVDHELELKSKVTAEGFDLDFDLGVKIGQKINKRKNALTGFRGCILKGKTLLMKDNEHFLKIPNPFPKKILNPISKPRLYATLVYMTMELGELGWGLCLRSRAYDLILRLRPCVDMSTEGLYLIYSLYST